MNHRHLLFDGAMGTYYAALYPDDASPCEWANLRHPARVRAIHEAYLQAGAQAIKTNTFGVSPAACGGRQQAHELLENGWALARQAAEPFGAQVFADIGPQPEGAGEDDGLDLVERFLQLGARCFLFETFADDAPVRRAAAYIRQKAPDADLVASFAVTPDGFTRQGLHIRDILQRLRDSGLVNAAGMNCVSGPHHLLGLARALAPGFAGSSMAFSVMPNAGYPTVQDGRTVFDGSPAYFAARCREMAGLGVQILGGCCGTTPAHIRQTAQALADMDAAPRPTAAVRRPENPAPAARNRLAEKLDAGKRVLAVELDPPADAHIETFLEGARRLKAAGVDAVTIADCPVARVRADSSMLAAKLRRELDIDPIPHMTCRDRNINATKALLLGLSIEQVHNVLVVTGDPIPSAERDEVKGVFSFHSAALAGYIGQLAREGLTAPFRVYAALNVNAPNFDAELKKAVRKQQAGVSAFFTQPVITERAFENLQRAHETLHTPLFGGVIPIVSHRNALFMSQEMAGIDIPPEIIQQYEGLDRAQAEALAVELSVGFAKRMEPCTAGLYLITPFQRVGLIERIIARLDL